MERIRSTENPHGSAPWHRDERLTEGSGSPRIVVHRCHGAQRRKERRPVRARCESNEWNAFEARRIRTVLGESTLMRSIRCAPWHRDERLTEGSGSPRIVVHRCHGAQRRKERRPVQARCESNEWNAFEARRIPHGSARIDSDEIDSLRTVAPSSMQLR